MAESKSSLLIDSPTTCMPSTETAFAGSVNVVATIKHFSY